MWLQISLGAYIYIYIYKSSDSLQSAEKVFARFNGELAYIKGDAKEILRSWLHTPNGKHGDGQCEAGQEKRAIRFIREQLAKTGRENR